MRVLLINTSERIGGAAIAAHRLLDSLNNNGVKTKLLVRDKQSDNISVVGLKHNWKHIWNFLWERFVIFAHNKFKKNNLFSIDIANTGSNITSLPEFQEADIIHLHWINQGFISLKEIKKIAKSGKPIVWTMHDMWPSTSVCHHSGECDLYESHCQNCPLILGKKKKDLSYKVFKKKEKLYREANITFVTCSKWLKNKAEKSALLTNHEVIDIPNPINLNLFKPRDKAEVRKELNLPKNKKLILFGSVKITDKRKGIDYLVKACNEIVKDNPKSKEEWAIVTFGQNSDFLKNKIPFEVFSQKYITNDKDLVKLYNAVDLFVTPSLFENLPNMIMEAMACGVPCVGFNIGGIPEMIDHLHNGYVAEYKSAKDLANGIQWVLNEKEHPSLAEEAVRKVAANYSEGNVAKKYFTVYNKVLRKKHAHSF